MPPITIAPGDNGRVGPPVIPGGRTPPITIAPGPILPPPTTTDEEHKAVADATPLGRWGGEMEIAKGVLALVESDFITGETIRIDGGRHLK